MIFIPVLKGFLIAVHLSRKTDSVDVCIAAIVKTLGVNLNLFQKDPRTKLITLTKYDCNEYKSTVNLFMYYYPGSKQGKHLDAHYNCYVNSQYYKQNAAAITSGRW